LNTEVKPIPVSSAMKVVATKNIILNPWKGSNDAGVPSSTICVATSAFATRHQKKEATAPAWTAVRMVRASEPWAKIEPVVKSWRMHVTM
jgi:hypothetical protein